MNKYLKSLIYIFSIIIILTFLITIFNYIGIISGISFNILKLSIPIISLFIGGIIVGKNSEKKGWLNGIKIGITVIIFFLIIALLMKSKLTIKMVIYYLILLSVTIFGSMIGINRK